jgi:molybdate transport system substrate-binding protein
MFVKLLDRLGIGEQIAGKSVLCQGGWDVCAAILEGRADIGTTFISEVLPVKGAKVVGPLPGDLHNANTYTAAVHAKAASPEHAAALLRHLVNPANRSRWTAAGLEPVF